MPIEQERYAGDYCPRCGAPMECVVEAYQNFSQALNGNIALRQCVVVLDNLRSAYNVGSIFRTADGLGVKHIYLCGITPTPDETPSIKKTALGGERSISWTYHPNGLTLVKDLQKTGHLLLGLEWTAESVGVDQYRLNPADGRMIALIVGNERAGVDPGILALCEAVLALPMAGSKASLNVAVAFGAAAYWLLFN
jgi:tRNA G18 (ribose-2'-O)-methylase SpoU